MDLLIAQFKLLPFWPALASFSGSYGLSEEVTVTLLIGALTAILSILMLPKSPPDLIALVSYPSVSILFCSFGGFASHLSSTIQISMDLSQNLQIYHQILAFSTVLNDH